MCQFQYRLVDWTKKYTNVIQQCLLACLTEFKMNVSFLIGEKISCVEEIAAIVCRFVTEDGEVKDKDVSVSKMLRNFNHFV